MYKKLSLILIICLESAIAFCGNPVMIVRCGGRRSAVTSIVSQGLPADCAALGNYVSYMGHCFPLAADGSCIDLPPHIEMVAKVIEIDGEAVTICLPKCTDVCAEECSDEPFWNPISQSCQCDPDIGSEGASVALPSSETCGCPGPLVPEEVEPSIIDGGGECVLDSKICYDLGITYTIDPFVCDKPGGVSDTITIVIKGVGGADLNIGEAVTIQALENCNLIDSTNALIGLTNLFGPDAEAAFVVGIDGCITIDFVRENPMEDSEIIFKDAANGTIVVPGCPRAFDPCSCPNPDNIVDADDVVLFWHDEMTVIGTPGAPITMNTNNSPAGFLDSAQQSVANGAALGTIGAGGTLIVPFFRTPGALTDVVITETVAGVQRNTTLMSSCALAVDACRAAPVNPVPTMGQWGLIVLGLMLLIFGIVTVRSRRIVLE